MNRYLEPETEMGQYARLLAINGFDVYVPTGQYKFFDYRSHKTDCWGTYQIDYFGFPSHTMPIRPSREHGSALLMPDQSETVAAARATAQPTNWNEFVGTQLNVKPHGIETPRFLKLEV